MILKRPEAAASLLELDMLTSLLGDEVRTCCKVDNALVDLLVGDGLPLAAAGHAEAKHGALGVDFAQALEDLDAGGAVLDQPVHFLLIIRICLHPDDVSTDWHLSNS